MPDFFLHVRHALRSLLRSPIFTISSVLTLAVCIGANVAIFSMVDTLLLRPLPFPDSDRLVSIEKGGAFDRKNMLRVDVAPWMRSMAAFSSVGLFTTGSLNMSGGSEPVHVKAAEVSPGFFTTFGVRPAVGRFLRGEDHQKGGSYAVVLSHGVWRRLFGADPSVAGRTVLINGRTTVVVGVMPEGFDFPDASEVWVPATLAETPFFGGLRWRFVARLRPTSSVAQAHAEGTTAGRNNLADLPPDYSFDVVPLHDVLAGPVRPTLLLFLAAVVVVLLVGCANVTNLVLARITARRTEMAVRAALGAGRGALVRQALVEIAIVALLGGVLGLLLAQASLSTILAFMPPEVAGLDRVGIDVRSALFALALSLVSVVLVGLVPSFRVAGMDLQETTKGAGRGMRTGHRYVTRVFVIAEMALAVLLSAGAALLARSFFQLATTDAGFQPRSVLTMTTSLMQRTYQRLPGMTPEEQAKAEQNRLLLRYHAIVERLKTVPGVQHASAVDYLPMSARMPMKCPVTNESGETVSAVVRTVRTGYFSTMGIPFVGGGDFPERSVGNHVIISRRLAKRFWGREWVPGRRVRLSDDPKEVPPEVIGVVGDVRSLGPEQEAPLEIYLRHESEPYPVMSLVVRTAGDPLALARRLREEITVVDPSAPLFRVQTMEQATAAFLAPRRTSMIVLGLFAACALLLAAVGVYGVTSYLVGLRTREFGVRMALGARASQLLRGVLRQSAVDATIAAAAGIAGALAVGRLLKSFLVNVAPTDPVVLGATCLALIAIGIASSVAPARRASKVDPAITLRVE